MNNLVLLLTAAALLNDVTHSANIKHIPDYNSIIEPNNGIPSKAVKQNQLRLKNRPAAHYSHTPGTTLELECDAIGTPAPVIHWYKNDAPLYEYDLESNEIVESNSGSFGRLESKVLVTRVEDKDVYTCVAIAGNEVLTATTTVIRADGGNDLSERSRLIPLEPRILLSYNVYIDIIGNNIILPCRAKGHPKPRISWSWRDSSEKPMKLDSSMKVLRSGDLMISNLRFSHFGNYTCHATNIFGSDIIATDLYPARPEE